MEQGKTTKRPITFEPAEVWRSSSGRRFFTQRAALRDHAKTTFRKKHPCTCEDFGEDLGRYVCDSHPDNYREIIDRYVRMIKYHIKLRAKSR